MSPYNSSPMENPPATAITHLLVGKWGTLTDYTISTGVATIGDYRNARINAETGTADALTQIAGLDVGSDVRISPASGDTITVTDGASLDLQGVNFIMNDVNDSMTLQCTASGVCKEISRSSND